MSSAERRREVEMSYPVKVVRSRAGYFQQCSGAPSAETGRHLIYSHECSHYGFQRIYRQPLVQPSCGVRASGDAFVALSVHAGQRGLPGGGSGGMPRCHQSGRGAIDRRWTDAYKQELVESRIMTTRKLVEAVNRLHEPPEVMISTSAVGYYSPPAAAMANRTIRRRIPFWRNCAWPGKRRRNW